jgi:hypothetical protein
MTLFAVAFFVSPPSFSSCGSWCDEGSPATKSTAVTTDRVAGIVNGEARAVKAMNLTTRAPSLRRSAARR